MNEKEILRNIKLYRWFQMLREPLFWGPVLIFYIQKAGHMSLPQIYFMEGIVVLGFMFPEIPSGALADLIGRKKTLAIGSLLNLICIIFFSLASSPLMVWVANIIWMIGFSLCSGADSAFLYDSLKEIGQEDDYKKIEGKAVSDRLLLIAFSSLIVGFLTKVHIRLPLLISIPGVLISCLATFCFKEPKRTEKYTYKKQMDLMKVSLIFVANHKKIKWIIGFTVLISVVSHIWFFTYNPYFELVELDLKYYGLMFFALNIVATFFSRYADSIEKRIGIYPSIIFMSLLVALPIFFMGAFAAIFSINFILLQNVVRGYMKPFLDHFLNKYIESKNRATVISIRSAISGLIGFIGLCAFGGLLKIFSIEKSPGNLFVCLQILGLVTLILGVVLIYNYKKIFK
jgi:MFS family permease